MSPASFETSALFATEHGSAGWTPRGNVHITLGNHQWILDPSDVPTLRETTCSLAGEVYHCERDCRWQLRVEDHPTVVLDSDQVLRLDALLDGAVAMLELASILDAAAIRRPVVADHRERG